jgi:hypothetical protein
LLSRPVAGVPARKADREGRRRLVGVQRDRLKSWPPIGRWSARAASNPMLSDGFR